MWSVVGPYKPYRIEAIAYINNLDVQHFIEQNITYEYQMWYLAIISLMPTKIIETTWVSYVASFYNRKFIGIIFEALWNHLSFFSIIQLKVSILNPLKGIQTRITGLISLVLNHLCHYHCPSEDTTSSFCYRVLLTFLKV